MCRSPRGVCSMTPGTTRSLGGSGACAMSFRGSKREDMLKLLGIHAGTAWGGRRYQIRILGWQTRELRRPHSGIYTIAQGCERCQTPVEFYAESIADTPQAEVGRFLLM